MASMVVTVFLRNDSYKAGISLQCLSIYLSVCTVGFAEFHFLSKYGKISI